MDLSTFLLAQPWLSKFSDSGVGDGGLGLDDGVGAGVGDVVGLHTQFGHKRMPDASMPRRCQVIFSGTCCFRSAERILYFGTTSQRPDATQTVRMPSVPCAALAYRCWDAGRHGADRLRWKRGRRRAALSAQSAATSRTSHQRRDLCCRSAPANRTSDGWCVRRSRLVHALTVQYLQTRTQPLTLCVTLLAELDGHRQTPPAITLQFGPLQMLWYDCALIDL
jgi:hypothetical protein